MSLDFILTIMTITGIASSWFYYLIIKPLRDAIYSMNKEIERLHEAITESITDRRMLDARISKLEEANRSLHERVKSIENIWKN